MEPVKVIPCLDMMNGRIVKGVHFQNMVDAGDPAECIARYCEEGADEIWMLDIKASEEGRRTNLEMIRRAAALCTVPLCIGGGIKNLDDVDAVMEAGARKVGIGSAALTNDEVIRRASYKYGPSAVTALVDVFRNAAGEYEVMGAGQKPSGKLLAPWIRQLADWGAGEILLTTMQDGAKTGYDLEATRIAAEASPLPVIASGGAGELVHFADAVKKAGARGVLAASVFHSGKFSIAQVKQYLEGEGIPVLRPGEIDLGAVRFDEKGLVPAIAQDAASGTVLMLAYMNRESLEQTLRTRLATYFSRSRQELWVKGATSGHYQHVREVRYDCDGDAILLKVDQVGAACHTGHYSCFFNPLLTLSGGRSSTMGAAIVQAVYDQVLDRKANPKEGSYTNKLLEKGVDKIGKKVVEEAAEVLIAAKNRSVEEVRFEVADLMYHLTVLLADQGMSWDDIYAELENRHR